jgi:RES domain-containing protein
VKVWRLCKRRHVAFDGEGARLAGGRWNRRGTAVVYTSETLSLAALELLAHCDPPLLPADLVAIAAELPERLAVERVEIAGLPGTWRRYPAPDALGQVGTDWARRLSSVALSVPSVLVPRERNVLLNPAHADFRAIRVGKPEPFSFDPRLAR